MSVPYLLLLLLCLSLHVCNARRLSSLDHKKIEKKTHFFIKNDDKNGVDLFPKQHGQRNGGDKRKNTGLVAEAEKPIMDTRRSNKKVFKVKGRTGSGSLQTHESLVSVSWRVPHKKNGDKNPGFNLDYSPPKTHPPSHN